MHWNTIKDSCKTSNSNGRPGSQIFHQAKSVFRNHAVILFYLISYFLYYFETFVYHIIINNYPAKSPDT